MRKINYSLKISLEGFKVIKLNENQIINEKIIDLESITQEIKEIKFNPKDETILDFNKEFGLFIMTNGAKTRLLKIKKALEYGFPIFLKGPTGASKTKSIQILSILMNANLIKYKLSTDTTTNDLFGRFISVKESHGCYSFQESSFIEAFVHGKWLLLDGIDNAPQLILQ